jgi:hypothetical protein
MSKRFLINGERFYIPSVHEARFFANRGGRFARVQRSLGTSGESLDERRIGRHLSRQ